MKTFHFSIVLGNANPDSENLEDRLFEAGCDDALVCAYGETVYLEFDREAETALDALNSATLAIKNAGFQIRSYQEGGVVNLSDIARRTQLTRAAVNYYAKGTRGPKGFPKPIYGLDSPTPLYDWAEVAVWLVKHDKLQQEAAEVAVASHQLQLGLLRGGAELSSQEGHSPGH
ncbi:XRE family transcriptional regulator [Saccharospirillum salsuginis]|uniref:DNA-binding protein n=1 Tax=Saccharospirillum salsuginis TaxID=418750 RepID=A0A918K4E0_9GAMM|nr:XRE family transcriptional regulator [Saccharospirillum salsuginis]GGX48889.1 DNA-binding protein [Saccharospirillum salsuginis]